jgi:hypothetical protein
MKQKLQCSFNRSISYSLGDNISIKQQKHFKFTNDKIPGKQLEQLLMNKSESSRDYYLSSILAAVEGCSKDLAGAAEDFLFPGPKETFTSAGLTTLSFSMKPRRDSLIIIPSLSTSDSSRATASCSYNKSNPQTN